MKGTRIAAAQNHCYTLAPKVLHYFAAEEQTKTAYRLTEKEKEILAGLVKGYRYKMTAAEMNIAYNTVNNHIRNIYDQ